MSAQANALADALDYTRGFTRWYLSLLKEVDPLKTFTVEGKILNPWYWHLGHIAWAQHFLVINSLEGPFVPGFEHLMPFTIGASRVEEITVPVKDLIGIFKEIQVQSVALVRTQTDEQLAQPNGIGAKFGDGTKKALIMHAITHEGIHCGNLADICKLNGIATR